MDIYRHTALFELIQILPNGDAIMQNAGNPSNVWIVPASQFNLLYEKVT